MGRVVVATVAGLNGLDLNPGSDVILASDAATMAAAIETLSSDPARRRSMERKARETAVKLYDWDAIAERQRALWLEA